MAVACAAVPPDEEQNVPVHGSGACQADAARSLVGRQASGDLGAEAMRLSGARALRWIRPGDVMTMDYREDRLNVELDSTNRVQAVRCG